MIEAMIAGEVAGFVQVNVEPRQLCVRGQQAVQGLGFLINRSMRWRDEGVPNFKH